MTSINKKKAYIIFEQDFVRTTVFYLKDQLIIGRSPDNDIYSLDPELSDHHAMVSLKDQNPVIEDLGSENGTLVNGGQIKKKLLAHYDTIQCGSLTFRFYHEDLPFEISVGMDSKRVEGSKPSSVLSSNMTKPSHRLFDLLPEVSLFKDIDKDQLAEVIREARLIEFEPDELICNQGDKGEALYIILDGKVRVYISDYKERKILLAILSDNQFFGEISLLTGAPRTASVEAIENTLLCEINANPLKRVINKWPNIKSTLQKYYQERLRDTEEKKYELGLDEKRDDFRFNIAVPVRFHISDDTNMPDKTKENVFKATSKDISSSGIKIETDSSYVENIPLGSHVMMDLILPESWKPIHCEGIIQHMSKIERERPVFHLGIEFFNLSQPQKINLEQFLVS